MLKQQIQEACETIRQYSRSKPDIAIILGTGLGALAKEIKSKTVIPYKNIPHFPLSTVETHTGQLALGKLAGKKVVAMEGRFHRYEGYTLQQVTFPVRVMKALGAKVLLVSNACGGINGLYRPGDLMVISDHINLLGDNPLIGPNDNGLGPRFLDMFGTYDPALIQLAAKIAQEQKIRCHTGVYAAMTGPSLETAAEYRFLRTIGADVIGMSTVPEVIVARHSGMRVLGISVVTDECVPENLKAADVPTIIRIAMQTEPKLTKLMRLVVQKVKV